MGMAPSNLNHSNQNGRRRLHRIITAVGLVGRRGGATAERGGSSNFGIDIVLVYLCPCGFDNPRNTLR
jgi:hypothetical protein